MRDVSTRVKARDAAQSELRIRRVVDRAHRDAAQNYPKPHSVAAGLESVNLGWQDFLILVTRRRSLLPLADYSPPFAPAREANWRGYLLLAVRVLVFIDEKNVYRDARRAFFEDYDTSPYGQFHPGALADRLVALTTVPEPQLTGVRVYTGRPHGTLAPKTYGAHMRQCATWQSDPAVTLKWRPLRYERGLHPPGPAEPDHRGEQKGVDVQMAIDLVRLYMSDLYDLAILASTDTDLLPAVELLYALDRGLGFAPIEVSAWSSDTMHKRLALPGHALWCHQLTVAEYTNVRDLRDYNIPT